MTPADTIFTRTYWVSEIEVFRTRFAASDLQEDEAQRLVSAICYLASEVVRHEPETKKETLEEFLGCYRLATARMGEAWVMRHIQIINTHGGPPPEDSTPT